MKTTYRRRRGFTLVELLVVIAIIATLAGVGVPVLLKRKNDGYRTEALMNMNQISKALFPFDQEYGSYPDDDSAEDISEDLGETVPGSGGSSNYYFRQLIVGKYVDQEKPFYCRTGYTSTPDNDMESNKMLEQGEVGFAYILKTGGSGFTSSNNSAIPLVVAALVEGSNSEFDQDVFNNKAVVLRIDTSCSAENIDQDGNIKLKGGRGLLDTGSGTVFGTSLSPEIVGPES